MINIFAYRPTIVIARENIAFEDCGVSANNTLRIVKIGDPFLSYNPSEQVNAIAGFEKDEAYFYFASQNIDLSGIADNQIPDDLQTTPGTNVFANKAFAGIALQTIDFATVGFDSSNLLFIYKIGDPYKSYFPTSDVNAIDGFEIGEPYYGYALDDMDLSAYLIPPIVVTTDIEQDVDVYKYYGTESTPDRGYYNIPVRFFDDEASLPATGFENIIYVAKAEGTSWYWDGVAYVQIGGGTSYTDEQAQDAVGTILSSEFTYDDATPQISINSIAAAKITGLATVASSGDYNDLSNKPTIPAAYTTENAQDDVGTILTDSNTIDFTYNDGTPSIVADAKTQMSITSDSSGLKLSGDSATPGNSKYYGTDSGGTKGFYSLPSITDTNIYNTDGTLAGNRTITGNNKYLAITGGRWEEAKGANVAAANDLTLGNDGNTFVITGNTQINAITSTNWQAGSRIILLFTGTPTIKHNTSGGAGTAKILLSGSADYTAAADDVLVLFYDGTSWHETTRKVVATGGGKGVTALANIGSSPNAQGASISGSTLTLQPASNLFGGVLTTGTQSIAGTKTFTDSPKIPVAYFVASTTTEIAACDVNGTIARLDRQGAHGTIFPTISKTANYNVAANDRFTLLGDATAGNITFLLPLVSSAASRIYVFKKTDASANTVTIDGNGSETIDGALTYVLSSQYKYVMIQCDGSKWNIIANN